MSLHLAVLFGQSAFVRMETTALIEPVRLWTRSEVLSRPVNGVSQRLDAAKENPIAGIKFLREECDEPELRGKAQARSIAWYTVASEAPVPRERRAQCVCELFLPFTTQTGKGLADINGRLRARPKADD
jgi:hypothetical protein